MSHIDGYLLLVAAIVILAIGLLYLGFIRAAPEPGSPGYLFWSFMRGRNRGGFLFVAGILLPLAVFAAWQAARVESLVGELVEPYPNASETVWVPDIDGDVGAATYLVKTHDSVEDVVAFYSIAENRSGWNAVSEADAMLQLTREDQTLFIMVSRDLRETTIAYVLSTD